MTLTQALLNLVSEKAGKPTLSFLKQIKYCNLTTTAVNKKERVNSDKSNTLQHTNTMQSINNYRYHQISTTHRSSGYRRIIQHIITNDI